MTPEKPITEQQRLAKLKDKATRDLIVNTLTNIRNKAMGSFENAQTFNTITRFETFLQVYAEQAYKASNTIEKVQQIINGLIASEQMALECNNDDALIGLEAMVVIEFTLKEYTKALLEKNLERGSNNAMSNTAYLWERGVMQTLIKEFNQLLKLVKAERSKYE
jgi:hypothetical protein